jgi:hypothetical protein
MIDTNSTSFQIEQNQFHSDKCPDCMSYLDQKGDCTNKFCDGLIPSEYRY